MTSLMTEKWSCKIEAPFYKVRISTSSRYYNLVMSVLSQATRNSKLSKFRSRSKRFKKESSMRKRPIWKTWFSAVATSTRLSIDRNSLISTWTKFSKSGHFLKKSKVLLVIPIQEVQATEKESQSLWCHHLLSIQETYASRILFSSWKMESTFHLRKSNWTQTRNMHQNVHLTNKLEMIWWVLRCMILFMDLQRRNGHEWYACSPKVKNSNSKTGQALKKMIATSSRRTNKWPKQWTYSTVSKAFTWDTQTSQNHPSSNPGTSPNSLSTDINDTKISS